MSFKIYRIEDLKESKTVGRGVYCGRDFTDKSKMVDSHCNEVSHPSIRDEFPDWYAKETFYRNHYCGFRNMKALHTWFEGWVEILLNRDFVISEYLVKDFLDTKSKKQLMFHPDNVIWRRTLK